MFSFMKRLFSRSWSVTLPVILSCSGGPKINRYIEKFGREHFEHLVNLHGGKNQSHCNNQELSLKRSD